MNESEFSKEQYTFHVVLSVICRKEYYIADFYDAPTENIKAKASITKQNRKKAKQSGDEAIDSSEQQEIIDEEEENEDETTETMKDEEEQLDDDESASNEEGI